MVQSQGYFPPTIRARVIIIIQCQYGPIDSASRLDFFGYYKSTIIS